MVDKEKVVKVTSKEHVIELFGRPYDPKMDHMWQLFRSADVLMSIFSPQSPPLYVVRAETEKNEGECTGPCCRKR